MAFAAAGVKRLILIGRNDSTLAQTKESLKASSNSTACLSFRADVADDKVMHEIATEVGTWDIFILNAGHIPDPTSIASANLADYWKSYEVCTSSPPMLPMYPRMSNRTIAQTNVKSVIIAATAFLPTANKTHASLLGVAAGALNFPPAGTPGLSAYMTSKIAMVKTLEFLAAENPGLFVASVHPGMIDTGVFRKSGAKPEMLPMDSGELISIPLLNSMWSLDQTLFLSLDSLTKRARIALSSSPEQLC